MRITALWLCGTLLALMSLPRTATNSGEGDILGEKGLGPCAATLTLEETCRQGRDGNTCPYLFSLPPLTIHLPKQLRELEEIVKDLQKLKDNMDQLRKMCADCTVSQSERECGRHSEKERENVNEGTHKHQDENKWMNERDTGKLNDCVTDRVKVEKTVEGVGDTNTENRAMLGENERKKMDTEKLSEKQNEKGDPLKEVTDKDGKIETKGAKGKHKLGQAKVPRAGGKERTVDMAGEKVFENNNRDADRNSNKEKDGERVSNGEPKNHLDNMQERKMTYTERIPETRPYVKQDETKQREKKTQNEEDGGSDGIKMSEEHDGHTDEEEKQNSKEKKKEMEKRIQAEQNNEKPKQTENTGSAEIEKTIKEGVTENVYRETRKEIKTEGEKTVQDVQGNSDGDTSSSTATERTDFVLISLTLQSTIGLDVGYDSLDSNEATTITSSFPSPHLPSSTSHLITDANGQMIMTAPEQSTQNTRAAGISEQPNKPTTDTANTLGGPGEQITQATVRYVSTTTTRPRAGFQDQVSSPLTTTTPGHNFYTTTLLGDRGRSHWTAKNNGTDIKPRAKPHPDRGPKTDKKQKPRNKPGADRGQKTHHTDQKPDQAPLPTTKPKYEQMQKASHQKPTTGQKSKPGKDNKHIQILKLDQRDLLNNVTTDQNHTTEKSKLSNPKPNSHQKSIPPVRIPSFQIPVNVNIASPNKDPFTDQQPEYDEISITNPNSKSDKKLHHSPKTKSDQKQTPGRKRTSEDKSKPDQRSDPNQNITHVQESESERSETTQFTSKPNPNQNENPSSEHKSNQDSISGKNLLPPRTIDPDQKPKISHKITKMIQKPKSGQMPKFNQKHSGLVTDQKPKPNFKPKPGKTPHTNQGIKTPKNINPNLNSKTIRDEIPEAESRKTVNPRPPPRHRPPTRLVLKPGATPLQRPKPAVQQKPSPKSKADFDLLHISVTTSNSNQNSETDPQPTSAAVKQTDNVINSLGNTELSPSTIKTVTLDPKTYNRLDTRSFTHLYTLPQSFTVSPNSRITSRRRPQAVGQPSLIPVTTRPKYVISSMDPGSTKPDLAYNADSSLPSMIVDNVEETASKPTPHPDKMRIPFLSPSTQTTSTDSPDFRSPTSAKSGPKLTDAESSTPSARELRVKINQVAALLNNSLSLNERPLDRGPKEPFKDNQGGSKSGTRLPTLTSSQVPTLRKDCSDHLLQGETKSGVYLVTPDPRSNSFPVLCDMELGGGGWTLIQRRQDGSVSFNRSWAEYQSGFGEVDEGEFWLGNNMIHLLTRDRDMVLRVELQDFKGVMKYAQYEQFRVASERLRYRLTVGGYSGNAGDALRFSKMYDHNSRAFTTPDKDHDRYPSGNCGAYYSSGWWFDACLAANLNGRYYVKRYKGIRDGIFWGTWHNISTEYYPTNYRQSFKSVRMMIRPRGFAP